MDTLHVRGCRKGKSPKLGQPTGRSHVKELEEAYGSKARLQTPVLHVRIPLGDDLSKNWLLEFEAELGKRSQGHPRIVFNALGGVGTEKIRHALVKFLKPSVFAIKGFFLAPRNNSRLAPPSFALLLLYTRNGLPRECLFPNNLFPLGQIPTRIFPRVPSCSDSAHATRHFVPDRWPIRFPCECRVPSKIWYHIMPTQQ